MQLKSRSGSRGGRYGANLPIPGVIGHEFVPVTVGLFVRFSADSLVGFAPECSTRAGRFVDGHCSHSDSDSVPRYVGRRLFYVSVVGRLVRSAAPGCSARGSRFIGGHCSHSESESAARNEVGRFRLERTLGDDTRSVTARGCTDSGDEPGSITLDGLGMCGSSSFAALSAALFTCVI
jgi:hypothetical protein